MAEPKTNPFAIPGLTDTDATLAEIAQKNVERIEGAQVEVKQAAAAREEKRKADAERGITQATRAPRVEADDDLSDEEALEASSALDRYLAPVQGAARNLANNSTIVGYKRQPPQPILSITDEEIEAKRTAGATAFDVYRAVYDDVDGDMEKLRAKIYNREDERVKALSADRDAMEAIVELVEDETEPYSWTYRNIYKRLGATPDTDDASVQQLREEFAASWAARSVRLGPNQTAFTEQISVSMPASIAELDLGATQRELIDAYREKLFTDAAFEPGKQLSQEEMSVIEAEAVRLATDDIEGAMSRLGRPRIYSITTDKTPYEMAQERKEKGAARVLDGAALSILEAKLRPRYASLPTEAGATDTALVYGTNGLMFLGQAFTAIDRTEWAGTAMEVAKREYKRNIKAEEEGDGDVDFSDVVLAAGKAAAAGNYSMYLQQTYPVASELTDVALSAVEPESLASWRDKVIEDTIVAAGDNEDLFDAATGAIPTFVAAGVRAATGEDLEPEIRKEFLENQLAVKTVLFMGAVAAPSVPVFDLLRGSADLVTPGLRRVKAAPAEIADKIERELADLSDDAAFDLEKVAADIGNAHGISADVIVRGVAESAAANAAERDANLLTRDVNELLKNTQEASGSLRAQAEVRAQNAAGKKVAALDQVLAEADLSAKVVDDLQEEALTPAFRALRDPTDVAPRTRAEAEAASGTFDAIGRWKQQLLDGDPGDVGDLQRLAGHMDDVLKETDATRQALDAATYNVDLSISAASARLTQDVLDVVVETSRAEKTLKRGFERLAEMKAANPTMAKVIEGIELHATNLRNQAALRKRLKALRQDGQTQDVTMPRADVEAKIKALDDLEASGTKLNAKQQVERVMLKDRLKATPDTKADVRVFSADITQTIHSLKVVAKRVEQSARALDDLKVANPKLHGEASGIIGDMIPAARVLSNVEKSNIAATAKIAQRDLRSLNASKQQMVRMYGKLDAVDAFVVLKSREKYKSITQRVKLKDSVLDEVTRRRGAAVRRAKLIVERRAMARAPEGAAKEAARAKVAALIKELRKTEGEATGAARVAAAQRLRQTQREALLQFAKSLRRGAKETQKRSIRGKSLTYRTGRPDEDLSIIDRARNALDSALGEGNVFGREVEEAQFLDLVSRAVAAVQDDIVKHMDDVEDVNYVVDRFAPTLLNEVTADTLKTGASRRALLGRIVEEHAGAMWRNFSEGGNKVRVENLRQAVTEAVDVAMQTRRAERDLSATLVLQQSIWARQGAVYAVYKLMSPRTGFIGEGSDQAWRVYQHADQTSAGFQAWLVTSSAKAIEEIMRSGGRFTRSELAERMIKTVSDAFDSTDGLARLGLPVDINSPFQVAKRFFTERTPSAHDPTLTPEALAVQDTTAVADINKEIVRLRAEQANAVRAHAENSLTAAKRRDKLQKEEADLKRLERELAALQKESTDNATAAADAKTRVSELEARIATAEAAKGTPPQQVVDAIVEAEDDALSRLLEDVANTKARVEALTVKIAEATNEVAPKLSPRQRADRGLQIKQKQRDIEVLKNQRGRVLAQWEAEQQRAAAARATLLGGDKNTPPPPILARMQAELAAGKTAEQIVTAALAEAENIPWSAAKRVRQAVDPNQRTATVGGWADTAMGDIEAALNDLAPHLNGKDSWRRVSPKTEAMLRRMIVDDADKTTNNTGRLGFMSALDEAKTVLDARRVLAEYKKKAVQYRKNRQTVIDEVMNYLKRGEPTETFEQSDIYKRYVGSIFDAEEEIARLKRSLDTSVRQSDETIKRWRGEKTVEGNKLKSLYGKANAQKRKIDSIKQGNFSSVTSDALTAYQKTQSDAIAAMEEEIKGVRSLISQYERFSNRDLTKLSDEVTARQEVVGNLRKASQTADASVVTARKRIDDALVQIKGEEAKVAAILNRAAALSPADVKSALKEGAFDEAALSVFDKMILNMGRAVFRGIQATNITDAEANRILYAVALDSIKKSNNFAELHNNIRSGILARMSGKVIDERAPRTVNSLAAALVQGIVSEYTSQYALREGLAIMDKRAAMSFNALFNKEIANSSGNGLNVIRDMYATLDEVLRVGARVARGTEGKSTIIGVERRAGDEMRLVEAAKLPGFAEGVWVPENVFRTALEDLESYARQMDVLVPTSPAEVGNWLLEKGKKIFSIWRTKVLVGYGVNKLGYRTRAIIGDIGSVYMTLGPKEAAKLAAVSLPNYLPFVREAAIKGSASLAKLPKKVLDGLVATSSALKQGTDPVRLLAPGSWRNLPRRSVAAILDSAAVVPTTVMGLAPVHVAGLLSGSPKSLLKIGNTEQTVAQWWQEMRVEGILDNNVQINLRTGLKQNTEIWADLTARRYSWFTVERRYRELRKTQPNITREDVRQLLETDDVARPLSVTKRIKYALMRHQESLEKTEAEVHVTTRVALYASLREKGLTAKEAADGVKAAVYDWNYGANRAALNMLSFVPFGRFHVLRQAQGMEVLNLAGDTSPWRAAGGASGAIRRAELLQRYMASVTGFDIPTEEELDAYLADARGFGMSMAEEWGMSPTEAASAAQQETLDFLLSAWWSRSHSPDYMANRQYFYEFIPPEQQKAFQQAYGTDEGHTLAMTSNVPPMGVMDAFDVLATGAALAEISIAYLNGEDRVAENAMSKLATPWFEKLPDVAKAALAVLSGKAGLELDAIEQGRHTPQMLAAAKPAEALLLNTLGYAPVTLGISQEPIRELLTTTRGDDDRPRTVGLYSKSLLAAMRMDPFITPHLTKAIDAAAYKNPKFGKDWDAIRATYTFSNLVGLTSYNVTDPLREATFDARDVQTEMTKKKQVAEGKAAQGERALNAREP